jgi:hypothetical protein
MAPVVGTAKPFTKITIVKMLKSCVFLTVSFFCPMVLIERKAEAFLSGARVGLTLKVVLTTTIKV